MKFWQKIYLFAVLVFIVIFNAASVMVIEQSHNKMLRQEMNSALSQTMSIRASVNAIVPILRIYDSIDYEKTVLTNIAHEFVDRNAEAAMYLEISDDTGRIVFSNADFQLPAEREELKKLQAGEITYILRDIGSRTILFTANITEVGHKDYWFTYMKDITSVYEDRMEQYRFFIQVDLGACILFMLIMYIISRRLTKPLDHLSRTAQVIAQGRFSERVQLKSRDEIGILANNFNEMAAVVEDKITDLERHNEEKQRFINNITHELKTPLTSIIGYANFMRTTKYNEELFLDGLQVIYSEAKRLEALSVKLMDLVMLRKEHFEMEVRDLAELIAEIKPALEMMAGRKQVRITFDLEAGCLMPLEPDLIKMMIFNLVDNAVKASSEYDTVNLRLQRVPDRNGEYRLQIIDRGIGIAGEHRDKVFEPFYMADKSRTRSSNGAGLGLAICQSVASLHKADIAIESEEQAGTMVTVNFHGTKLEGDDAA
ncbi:ATP-binding protein [Paenibacillus sp. GCM10027626]|uniref:sensor histidine kinase n=1 Tax=Paenibacillus sp. GCM10027626 TaxID=3273411 RepID=UPI0036443D29